MNRNPIPMSLTKPFTFAQPLDMEDAREAMRECASARRQAREWKQRCMQAAAEGESAYRKARAEAWVRCPSDKIAKEKEDWVNAETIAAREHRDVAVALVRAADERLLEVDGERASVHRLVEWSMKVAPVPDQVEVSR